MRTNTGNPAVLPFIIGLMLLLTQAGATASAEPEVRERLTYQVYLGPWDNVAQVHLVLKQITSDRYLAEFSGAAQGMWRLLSRWLPERYQTEMVYRDRRLLPLLYREEFRHKGKNFLKEYRFDYEQRRLTLWEKSGSAALVKEWEGPLQEPVFDLLSLFYNFRLGALGPISGGASLRIALLPAPEPQDLLCRFGPVTASGRKVMITLQTPGSSNEAPYFVILGPEQVPTLAWTRVAFFGKIGGRLLNPGGIPNDRLLSPAQPAAPDSGGAVDLGKVVGQR